MGVLQPSVLCNKQAGKMILNYLAVKCKIESFSYDNSLYTNRCIYTGFNNSKNFFL